MIRELRKALTAMKRDRLFIESKLAVSEHRIDTLFASYTEPEDKQEA